MGIRGETHDLNMESVPELLLKMIQSKRFFPSTDWIMPKYGESLHRDKAWALLKCCALQEHVNTEDIELVFLNDHRHENITRERLFEYIRDMHYDACQNGPQTCALGMMEMDELFHHIVCPEQPELTEHRNRHATEPQDAHVDLVDQQAVQV